MAHWDTHDVDREAAKIAQAYLAAPDGGADMKALAIKVARAHDLNAEQVRRLCRAANVKAFEQKFASMAGQPDRVAEYDPVDAEAVIHDLFRDAAPVAKTAAARYPHLPDELRAHRPGGALPPPRAKTAEEHWLEIERLIGRDPPPEVRHARTAKVAEELGVRARGAELRWNHAMEALGAATRRLYWDHDAFEKDAVAIHGADVLPELNALRRERGLDPLDAPAEKVAALRDALLGEETPEVVLVKRAADARVEYLRCDAARREAEARLAGLRKQVIDRG